MATFIIPTPLSPTYGGSAIGMSCQEALHVFLFFFVPSSSVLTEYFKIFHFIFSIAFPSTISHLLL